MSKTAVIGGGAAGMMAALAAAGKGHRVVLYEKNEKLGKKVFITGKGRCNVTNDCTEAAFLENVIHNSSFLYSAIYGFTSQDMMKLLRDAGCPIKVERGGRVFPESDHASDVIKALQALLIKAGVTIRFHAEVTGVFRENGRVAGVMLKDGSREMADAVIVCTGGLSYPSTGSTGDGYRFAAQTGHGLVAPEPALAPFEICELWCGQLQGLALKNVEVSLWKRGGKKPLYRGFGEMLFTHFGVSGPLILSASCYYSREKCGEDAVLRLDLKPALSEEQLDKRILRDFEENKNRQFKNAINSLFPSRLIPVMIEMSGIHRDKKIHEISREERREFVRCIKGLELTVMGTRDFAEAIITRGGVQVKDVNPSTMESRVLPGLYFAGEVLDVEALTGGYNLQIAWSTGHLAGSSIGAS